MSLAALALVLLAPPQGARQPVPPPAETPPPSRSVRVTPVDASGDALLASDEAQGAEVLLWDELGRATPLRLEPPGASGAFVARDVAAGPRWISLALPGRRPLARSLPQRGDVDLRLELAPARRVRVLALTPRGRPLRERFEGPDALAPWLLPIAFAAKQVPERVFALEPGRTCHGGAFRSLARGAPAPELDARVLGELEVHVEPPLVVGLALNGRVVASRALAELPAEVELVVDPAELERAGAPGLALELVDAASGAPVGARVRVPDPHGGPAFDVRLERWVPPFDALGVEVFPAERAPFVLELPPGEHDEVRVEVPRARRVHGRVVLPAGTVDARLRAFVDHATEGCFGRNPWSRLPVPESAADLLAKGGVFALDVPAAQLGWRGVHLVAEATTSEGRTWSSRPVALGGRTGAGDIVVPLEPAWPVVLLAPDGAPLTVDVSTREGTPFARRTHLGGGPLTLPLLPGDWTLCVRGRPWRVIDRELAVEVGEGRLVFVR